MPQPTKSPWMTIRRSGIHNRGGYATRHIPAGTKIIPYVGRKVSKAAAEKVYERSLQAHQDNPHTAGSVYLFVMNSRYDIDGSVAWNTARYINHGCDPNCETEIINGRIWIVALRDIRKGEELVYDYAYDFEDWQDHPCRCGSDKCIGYIIDRECHKKLHKVLQKRGQKPPGKWWRRRAKSQTR